MLAASRSFFGTSVVQFESQTQAFNTTNSHKGRLCVRANATNAEPSQTTKNAVVIGAGPAGMLLAHFLVRRPNNEYKVSIYEKRADPATVKSIRQYSLGLGIRGRTAIKGIPGLWDAVVSRGVSSDAFYLHLGKWQFNLRQRGMSEPSCLINRGELCAAMAQQLQALNSPNLSIQYEASCEGIDLNKRTVTVVSKENGKEVPKEVPYDLLVGADGANSVVRATLEKARSDFVSQYTKLNSSWKVLHQPMPQGLAVDSVHAMGFRGSGKSGGSFGLFMIPEPDKRTCILISWQNNRPPELLSMTDPDAIVAHINERFPNIGGITREAAEQFLQQQPSTAGTVRCSRYHDSQGRVLILGDAAHSSGGTTGQGCNASLQDAAAFNDILDRTGGDLDKALTLFSQERVPEGDALLELAMGRRPRNPILAVLYFLTVVIRFLIHRIPVIGPKLVLPPVTTLLTQSLMPFSKIRDMDNFWMEKA
eukprot:jgi/Mesvir1/6236/Mv00914-RA.1